MNDFEVNETGTQKTLDEKDIEILRLQRMIDNEKHNIMLDTKERILGRLHDRVGLCVQCGEQKCRHGVNTQLPSSISRDDLIYAIDLDFEQDK